MGKYTVGKRKGQWGGEHTQTLTFIVTSDCNLRCKYCYVTHKAKSEIMPFEVAKEFIDYILKSKDIYRSDSVILDFIGGEPLLEAQLIEKICDYFKIETYKKGSSWYWNYRINISTNGVNYSDDAVQKLIKKNLGKISVGFSIDGTREKHDLQRVFPNGTGSYDYVMRNINLWKIQFQPSTKMTFASEDLIYLKDSVIDLWEKGIEDVSANVVYEDVWKEGDDKVFESQLKELADYIIDNNFYDKYYCTLFSDGIGMPYEEKDLKFTSCGAGKMLALDYKGDIYPCMRYCSYSLNNKRPYIIGNVSDGINAERLRPFLLTMYKYQCDEECLNCPVAKGCEFCQGFNYDEADTETNFQKAKYICKMHKARVKANNYYFAKLYHKKGIRREGFYWQKELLFLIDNYAVTICSSGKRRKDIQRMDRLTIEKGLKFAEENFMRPVFLHSENVRNKEEWIEYEEYEILHRLPISSYKKELPFYDYQLVVSVDTLNMLETIPNQEVVIFNIEMHEIKELYQSFTRIIEKCDRLIINLMDINKDIDFNEYKKQLLYCADWIAQRFKMNGEIKEVNILTDLLYIEEHEECQAGTNSLTYAPDGRIYICPSFYAERFDAIGTPEEGVVIPNKQLFDYSHMPLCQMCDAFQCENCKFINKLYTNEVNISPSFQCIKAQVEKSVSLYLEELLGDEAGVRNKIIESEYMDPIVKVGGSGVYKQYHEE